jgi:iron complex outermembrane receptor protein
MKSNSPSNRVGKQRQERGIVIGAGAAVWLAAGSPLAALADASVDRSDQATAGQALEEVVVTARKRVESLQDAPISISVFSASDLQARGVEGMEDLTRYAPNLVVQSNPGNGSSTAVAAVYIRGVGQDDFQPTIEPGVGIYIDGVYLARSVGALLDVLDVERIEVLRGPQGTLFGRNTIGGAISVTTKKPDSDFSGFGEITFGDDQRINGRAALNVPLTDNLFGRISVGSFNQDGYVERLNGDDDLGSDDTLAGRIALRWVASEDLEVNFSADATRDRESGAPYVISGIQYDNFNSFVTLNNVLATGDPFSCHTPAELDNPRCYNDRYVLAPDRSAGTYPQYSDLDVRGVSLTIDYDAGPVDLKSITSYRDLESEFARDFDGSDLRIADLYEALDQHQFSQELQALGSGFGGRLSWIAGLYFFDEGGDNPSLVELLPATLMSGGEFGTTSWAAFSQATVDLTQRWSITLGLRYTDEEKEFTPDQYVVSVHVPPEILPLPPGTPLLPSITKTISAQEWTPLVSVSYDWTPDVMTYASYSEGFKSGGFTQRVFPPEPSIPTFDPEYVKVYELGFKLTGAGGRLRLNGAAFHTQYDDMQVLTANLTRVGPFIENAAQAEIDGFELELAAIPANGWNVQAGVGYLDPQYKEIEAGALEISTDNKFRRISDWSFSTSISKDIELAGSTLTPRVDWSYRSSYFNDSANTPELETEGQHLVSIDLTWEHAQYGLALAVGVDNLLDDEYLSNGFLQPNFGMIESLYDRGRQWHFTARKTF